MTFKKGDILKGESLNRSIKSFKQQVTQHDTLNQLPYWVAAPDEGTSHVLENGIRAATAMSPDDRASIFLKVAKESMQEGLHLDPLKGVHADSANFVNVEPNTFASKLVSDAEIMGPAVRAMYVPKAAGTDITEHVLAGMHPDAQKNKYMYRVPKALMGYVQETGDAISAYQTKVVSAGKQQDSRAKELDSQRAILLKQISDIDNQKTVASALPHQIVFDENPELFATMHMAESTKSVESSNVVESVKSVESASAVTPSTQSNAARSETSSLAQMREMQDMIDMMKAQMSGLQQNNLSLRRQLEQTKKSKKTKKAVAAASPLDEPTQPQKEIASHMEHSAREDEGNLSDSDFSN